MVITCCPAFRDWDSQHSHGSAACHYSADQLLRIQGKDRLAGDPRDAPGDRRGSCFVPCLIQEAEMGHAIFRTRNKKTVKLSLSIGEMSLGSKPVIQNWRLCLSHVVYKKPYIFDLIFIAYPQIWGSLAGQISAPG